MSRNQAAIIARLTKERDAAYDALVKMHETANKIQCPQCGRLFAALALSELSNAAVDQRAMEIFEHARDDGWCHHDVGLESMRNIIRRARA